jgi:hypothetical protein
MGFGGQGNPAKSGDATWLHTFFPDQFWDVPGGDFNPTILASQTIGNLDAPYTWTSPELAASVQAWLDDPCSNFGWILIGNEAVTHTAKKFASREHPLETSRPRLTINYTPGVACAADVAPGGGNGVVDVSDLLALLASWGQCGSPVCCPGDIAPDGGNDTVDVSDLLALLAAWGQCP